MGQMAQMNPMGQMNNMMMGQNMFMNNMLMNIPQPISVTLEEAFEYFKKNNYLSGQNKMHCNNCGLTIDHVQINKFYTLPEILTICLNRGKNNIYKVGITYPENINLDNEVETKFESHNYRLICIITHLGPGGLMGHFVAFCFLEDKNAWYEFNDSIVTPSSFEQASKFGETYVLFYKRV